MITQVESEKLIVISDLHLGNPFCRSKQRVLQFLRWAGQEGYDICINGDGFEVAQVSFSKLARDVPDVLQAMQKYASKGRHIYYVVGNHDMVFENFLNDWGGFKVAPFLNVISGDKRIRVEHGHLYDPFFVRYPELYEFCTWAAGFLLSLNPTIYKLWIKFEKLKSKIFKFDSKGGIVGESPQFMAAAQELIQRGFDTVVFGHTHHVGEVQFETGNRYLNPGSWMLGSYYVEIVKGEVTLRNWLTQGTSAKKVA